MVWRAPFALFAATAIAAAIVFACGTTTDDIDPAALRDGGSTVVSEGGSLDAIPDGASTPSGYRCANDPVRHDFCEDFEGPLYFGPSTWTRPNVYSAGRVRIENGGLVSEILEHDASDSYNPAELFLERNWALPDASATKRLTMKYRLAVDRCSGIVSPGFLGGVNRPPWYAYTVQIWITQGVDCTVKAVGVLPDPDAGPTVYAAGSPISIPTGTFVDYSLTLEEIAGAVTVRLSTGAQTSTASFNRASTGDVITVIVGAGRPWQSPSAERIVTDDVRVDNGK
jgi:hypothetical protein